MKGDSHAVDDDEHTKEDGKVLVVDHEGVEAGAREECHGPTTRGEHDQERDLQRSHRCSAIGNVACHLGRAIVGPVDVARRVQDAVVGDHGHEIGQEQAEEDDGMASEGRVPVETKDAVRLLVSARYEGSLCQVPIKERDPLALWQQTAQGRQENDEGEAAPDDITARAVESASRHALTVLQAWHQHSPGQGGHLEAVESLGIDGVEVVLVLLRARLKLHALLAPGWRAIVGSENHER